MSLVVTILFELKPPSGWGLLAVIGLPEYEKLNKPCTTAIHGTHTHTHTHSTYPPDGSHHQKAYA